MLRAHGRFTPSCSAASAPSTHSNAHPQQLGYLTNPLAIVPRREHPLAQILRISPASLVPSPASGLHPQINPISEDPSDSTKPKNALMMQILLFPLAMKLRVVRPCCSHMCPSRTNPISESVQFRR